MSCAVLLIYGLISCRYLGWGLWFESWARDICIYHQIKYPTSRIIFLVRAFSYEMLPKRMDICRIRCEAEHLSLWEFGCWKSFFPLYVRKVARRGHTHQHQPSSGTSLALCLSFFFGYRDKKSVLRSPWKHNKRKGNKRLRPAMGYPWQWSPCC